MRELGLGTCIVAQANGIDGGELRGQNDATDATAADAARMVEAVLSPTFALRH